MNFTARFVRNLGFVIGSICLLGSAHICIAQMGPVSFSPDGKSIVFAYEKPDSCFIYKADVHGGMAARLTKNQQGCESDPAFSDDGKLIAYSYAAPGGRHSNLYLINADGSNPHLLLESDADDIHPVFAHDGKALYFMRSLFFGHYSPIVRPRRHDFGLFRLDLNRKRAEALTNSKFYEVSAPSLSPDGKSIAFSIFTQAGEILRFYSVADGQETLKLEPHVSGQPSSGPILSGVCYMPDGKGIIFQAASNGSPYFNYDVYRMGLDGGKAENLTHSIGYASGVRPSPDGKTAMLLKWDVSQNTNELEMLDMATGKISPVKITGLK